MPKGQLDSIICAKANFTKKSALSFVEWSCPRFISYFNNQSENTSAKFYFQGTPGEDKIPLDEVLAATRSLAILHAQFFLDSNLLEPANVRFNWLRKFGDPTYLQEIVEKWKYYWSFAKQRLEHKVRHDFYSILSDPIKIKTLITDLAKNAPMTLVHTDVWINNFCFVNDQFCALDWQAVMIGPGVIDLGKEEMNHTNIFWYCTLFVSQGNFVGYHPILLQWKWNSFSLLWYTQSF